MVARDLAANGNQIKMFLGDYQFRSWIDLDFLEW